MTAPEPVAAGSHPCTGDGCGYCGHDAMVAHAREHEHDHRAPDPPIALARRAAQFAVDLDDERFYVVAVEGSAEKVARVLGEHEEEGWTDMDRFECTCGSYVHLEPITGSVDRAGAVEWLNTHFAAAVVEAIAGQCP